MKKCLGVLIGVLIASLCADAEFSKGEVIELTQDAPLLFKQVATRLGKKGERFTVLLDQPAEHRVYVLSRDAKGQEIALSVAEDSVASVQNPPLAEPKSVLPLILAARASVAERAMAMKVYGGKPESEEAVLRGLRWLVANQNADGSWGKGDGPVSAAMTGFSILSLVGHGETPASPEFGPAIQKAIDWTIQNGGNNEGRLSMEKTFTQQGVYAHAIMTYGLSEYYAMTKDERVVDLLKKAVGYIVDGQGPDGGWMYSYDKSMGGDTSVSGWQVQALKAAHMSGLNIDDIPAALDKAMLNFDRVHGKNGGFGYRNAQQERYSLTGVGVLCIYLWKQKVDFTILNGIAYIMDHTTKRQLKDEYYPVDYMGEKADLYAWYYNTLACAYVGGPAWDKWNKLIQDQLTHNQSPDGSWPAMQGKAVGDFQRSLEGNGPLYRTNFCILMLEVYYRYQYRTP